MNLTLSPNRTYDRYRVSVDKYVRFREQGFLVVPGLVPAEDVLDLNNHVDNLLAGRETIEGANIMSGLGNAPRPATPACPAFRSSGHTTRGIPALGVQRFHG